MEASLARSILGCALIGFVYWMWSTHPKNIGDG